MRDIHITADKLIDMLKRAYDKGRDKGMSFDYDCEWEGDQESVVKAIIKEEV